MQYGICLLSVVPCRKEPLNTSEMVTQLLFGDSYELLEIKEGWLKIKISYDAYECWINQKQHSKISEANYKQLQKNTNFLNSDLFASISSDNINFPITIGCELPFLNDNKLVFESNKFEFDGDKIKPTEKKGSASILKTAKQFINAPYLWGGKTPFGVDCSGFTQLVYKLNGHKLPRDASQQVELGSPLNFVEEAEAGDLAFFDNEEGKIVHVGILINNEQIIHASGCVRIDKFDHYGIFNSTTKKYSHMLRVIKRLN